MQTLWSLQSAPVAQVQPAPESSGGQSALLPVQYSGTSHGPADGRHTVPAFPGTLSQNFTPPVPVAHLSTVHGLWSSQSASELQFEGVITQSDGSEFGRWDG